MNHLFGKKALAWVLFLPMCVCAFAQENVLNAFTSPNGKIEWRTEEKGKQVQAFSITYREGKGEVEVLKISDFGLLMKDGGGKTLSLQTISKPRLLKEHYQMLLGKKSDCRNEANEVVYTPCTFSDSQHPHITTNAHELALPVLYESALLHWADKPESYLVQPKAVQDFITNLPTTWDETRLLCGYPGEYVVMARRKGNAWYVAGINGMDVSRSVTIDWSILEKRKGKALLFEDGKVPKSWRISSVCKRKLPKKMVLQPRGGFVFVI